MMLAMGVDFPGSAIAQALEVRLTQGGIAGDTGNGWRVEPSGTWAAFRIQNGTAETPRAQGTLKPEDITKLKDALDQNNFVALPDKVGGFRSANPETLTIRMGTSVKVLKVPGGTDLTDWTDQKLGLDSAGQHVVAIFNTVRTLTAP